VINNIETTVKKDTSRSGLAYFYCDVSDTRKRNATDILRSLVVNLLVWQPGNQSILDTVYQDCMGGYSKPSDETLYEALRQFISAFQKAYILIDALDECLDREKIMELVETIHGWDLEQCHLLVTSRKEQWIIESMISTKPMEVDMTQMPVDTDIEKYIDSHLHSSVELRRWSSDEKASIRHVLLEKAKGM
jgi:hypothetical protein